MREIKFRGWNPLEEDKHMFYFDLDIIRDEENEANWQNLECVMQFTGLFDKNNVEIYESDIVKEKHFVEPLVYVGHSFSRVDFGKIQDNNTKGWILTNVNGIDGFYLSFDNVEVVGNIYENPELIK